MRIGLVVCLTGELLLTSAGARARRPPASRCRTGRFVTSTGSLLTDATAGSDTIVLDAEGKASVTNRCTAVRARLSGGRKSTQLSVRWPAGACRDVKGAVKLTATIKGNCGEMGGLLRGKKIRHRFKAGRFVCPMLLKETADGLACSGAEFTPGSASTAVTLDPDGRFPSAITLTTDHGVTAHVDAGTQVHGLDGEVVPGDVELVLDDGGGVAAYGGADPIQAIVRLLVRRRSDGAALRVDFDPPVKVDLEIGDFGLPGTWLTYAYADGDSFATGPAPGAEQVFLGLLQINDDSPEQLAFTNSMVMGLGFAPDAGSTNDAPRALAASPQATVSVTFPVPNDPPAAHNPDGRICEWGVYAMRSAEILVQDIFVSQPPVPRFGKGFGVGESRTKRTVHGRTYTAKLVARGEGRALEVTSDFHNRVILSFRICNPDGTRARHCRLCGRRLPRRDLHRRAVHRPDRRQCNDPDATRRTHGTRCAADGDQLPTCHLHRRPSPAEPPIPDLHEAVRAGGPATGRGTIGGNRCRSAAGRVDQDDHGPNDRSRGPVPHHDHHDHAAAEHAG
jgi:hypothetical protein